MSAQNAPAETVGVQARSIEDALGLLEEALALLDNCNAAAELRARLHEIIEVLKRRSV